MNLLALQYTQAQIDAFNAQIRQGMLADAPYARVPNFTKLVDADVALLFRLYDRHFFSNQLHPLVVEKTGVNLRFRASGGMTSSGGKTTRFRARSPDGTIASWFEIAIAGRLLFTSFREASRAIHVCGLPCDDRLDAMQRIMEHELIHLAEMLTFGNSSCARTRFMALAGRVFGHAHRAHQLITVREHAAREFNVHVGDDVQFESDGQIRRGQVNRVGQRASVLVPDPAGLRYSDGRHYVKFYVPLAFLKPARSTQKALADR